MNKSIIVHRPNAFTDQQKDQLQRDGFYLICTLRDPHDVVIHDEDHPSIALGPIPLEGTK